MIHFLLDWMGYWFVRFGAWIAQRLPLEAALGVGRGLGGFAYFLSNRRRVAYVNLKAAFRESTPRQRKNWTKQMFRHLGMNGIEMVRTPLLQKADIDRYVHKPPEYNIYLQYLEAKKGLILLTAHMGNWEFSQIMEGVYGRPLTVLARKQKYGRLNELLNSFRQYHGSVSVGKEKGGIRDLIRCLREGGCVGMLGDQSGGDDGVWIRFFERWTLSPRGPIVLALKMGIPVLPVFFVRKKGAYHELFFEPSFQLVRTGDFEKDIQVNTQNYIQILESYLKKFPSQWLWGHKRWKRTRTKRILILSDGKPGHVKQSEALVQEIVEKGKRKEPPYETQVEKIEVQFRSPRRRQLFSFFSLFFIPWVQGRLAWLSLFLTPESVERLERSDPDVVVSAGASLVPLNLCLTRENLAKSIIVMKPGFPFNLFRYDLALIPAHDRGWLPRGHCRIQGALANIDAETLETSKDLLARSLRKPEKVRFSVFLGGETRNFKPSLSDFESLLSQIERISGKLGGDFLVTTSRRTPETVERFLVERLARHPRCQLCVIASRDKRPEVVPGMMALADYLIVTEDSLSMISEALSTGKNVVVVKMSSNGLPRKHHRFQKMLEREGGVPVVETARLCEVLSNPAFPSAREFVEQERGKIREKLETLF